jgi:tetratricopeptide (TPR) repeat protein
VIGLRVSLLGEQQGLSAAASLVERNGDKERAAIYLLQQAVRETQAGDFSRAPELINQAQKLSRAEDVRTLTALVLAQMGNAKLAQAVCKELDKEWPEGTYMQKYWLPLIRAQIDLQQRQPVKALEDLGVATPLELSNPDPLPVATLYPVYVRAQAYLATGDGPKAAAEFKKLIDNRSLVLNFPLAAQARLGMARAWSSANNKENASQSYQDFLALWRDADPDLPVLKQAKAEYAKLK